MIPKGKHHDHTDEHSKKAKQPKAPKLFSDELIDQLLAQVQNKNAESILGEFGLAGQLKKQLAERMPAGELIHHLNTEATQGKAGNHRNGSSPKTVLTPNGEMPLDIPRDRLATFEPQLVAKYQRRLPGFDDHVISMYARGTRAGFRAACSELRAHKGLQA
jgi:putative transposase